MSDLVDDFVVAVAGKYVEVIVEFGYAQNLGAEGFVAGNYVGKFTSIEAHN